MIIATIGVYGFTEERFFQALQLAGVDTLCDVRQRRGVRGSNYAFANSRRLQARLAELGIRYLHAKELAPTPAIRARQNEADWEGRVAKRQRASLAPAFVSAYQAEILERFDPQAFHERLPPDAAVVALLCVEREPMACHRSLVADRLGWALGIEVEHIRP